MELVNIFCNIDFIINPLFSLVTLFDSFILYGDIGH